jgi:hypothetical protein
MVREAPPETRVVKKLAAGARGAQRWQRQYGDRLVCVRFDRDEADVRARAKAGGAHFDWHKRLWIMPAGAARQLGLARRIVRASEATR